MLDQTNHLHNTSTWRNQMSEYSEPDMVIPSGLFGGWYSQPKFNVRKAEMSLALFFSDFRVRGDGEDILSDFYITDGRYNIESKSVNFTKQYANYGVRYYGHWIGGVIQGWWEINMNGFYDKDIFMIYPLGTGSTSTQNLVERQPRVKMNWQGNVKWTNFDFNDLI